MADARNTATDPPVASAITVERPRAASPVPIHDDGAPPLPPELTTFMRDIDRWATLNRRDARRDTARYWLFKLPAIASSAFAGVLALNHLASAAALLSAVAGACALIDAINPGGQLRNAHLCALHDLRDIENDIVNRWRVAALRGSASASAAAAILEEGMKARERVALALKLAETSFASGAKNKR